MRLVPTCLLLLSAPLATAYRRPKPLSRRDVLRVLSRLTVEGSRDEISVDIGGTLAKVVVFQPCDEPPPDGEPPRLSLGDERLEAVIECSGQRELSMYAPALGGNLHFFVFESQLIESVRSFIERRKMKVVPASRSPLRVQATGGGAFQHQTKLSRIGFKLDYFEDHVCMINGLDFLLNTQNRVKTELFTVQVQGSRPLATPGSYKEMARNYCEYNGATPRDYLYVSVSTETLVLEVRGGDDGVTRYRRLGSSSVGGSTFWGLMRLLTSCETFDEVIRLTEMEGASSARVDMQVGDIYGGDVPALGLSGDVIAASFGKVAHRKLTREGIEGRQLGPRLALRYLAALLRHYEEGLWLVVLAIANSIPGLKQLATALGLVRFAEMRAASVAMCGSCRAHDVALSLLRMVSNNIGQLSVLYAEQAGLERVVFGGSFIRDHPFTIATISSAVHFFSRGRIQPFFLKHDGFVGAIGAHLAGRSIAGACERLPPRDSPLEDKQVEVAEPQEGG